MMDFSHGRSAQTALTGELVRVRYEDDQQGFSVFDVQVDAPQSLAGTTVTAVGSIQELAEGLEVRLSGEFRTHPRFGRQFKFSSGMVLPPGTGRGIRAFLASGRVEGIGRVLAERLSSHFGDGLREALDAGEKRLVECPGIGPGRAGTIAAAWRRSASLREVVILLCDMGLTPAQASRIAARWGEAAPTRVAADPYELQRQLRGFGFRSADLIASAIGIAPDSPLRLKAAVRYMLSSAEDAGHLYMNSDSLVEEAAAITGTGPDVISSIVSTMIEQGDLSADRDDSGDVVYLPENLKMEVAGAAAVHVLVSAGPGRAVSLAGCAGGFLAPSQIKALNVLISSTVSILTGGPGTGKTTVTAELIRLCALSGMSVALAAPTGRAAMRLRETSGHEAMTLHRLLEFNPADGRFTRCRANPLDVDWVIVDESSMIDMSMFSTLLSAIRPGCRLTLVGDADQLPPVGPGDPFRQLISSGCVPVARLSEVFRQGEGSSIVSAAHRIISGMMPDSDRSGPLDPGEFHIVMKENPEDAADMVVTLVCERIPARFGLDPLRDIQVLAPMKKGSCGTDALNYAIRQRLRPDAAPVLSPGDRVIQTRNNYQLDVFNGDIGLIVSRQADGGLIVRFDQREVSFSSSDADDLAPASAVTVHKSQGSEFPAVVVCMHNQHFVMLRRNLLYTAVTRGRRLVVVVCSDKALGMAVRNFREEPRNTMFSRRLVSLTG
jgi:exodeoxyribonuclease V alpha subunit